MGQTLTHGVYLPNEGERNCYSGLASNWRLLDGAIGTVAAHTTAIAGKADISHSHGNISNDGKVGTAANKPLITGTDGAVQAGSFGNQANTFCEGNDSRLSDARTPVAHTHTKSDVTDLLNSDFIPSANNSYDLGSSSYQWSSVYAQNYYYKGVACGDILTHNVSEFVDVSGNQTIGGVKTFSQEVTMFGRDINLMSRLHYGKNSNPSDSCWHYVFFRGNTASEGYTNAWYSGFLEQLVNPDGSVRGRWVIRNTNENSTGIQLTQSADGSSSSLIPVFSSIDLGTSTNKWKTLNGVNPGALCFPEGTTGNANTTFNPDLTNWLTDGTGFTITAQVTGWLHIRIQNSTGNFAWVKRASAGSNQTWGIVGNSDTNSDIADIPLNVPVVQGYVYTLKLKTSRLSAAIFMCLGNV